MSAEPSTEPAEVVDAPEGFADGTAFQAETAPTAEGEPAAAEPAAVEPAAAAAPVVEPPTPAIDPRGILRDLQSERQSRQEAQQEVARLKGQLEGIELQQRRGAAPAGPQPLSASDAAKATTWAHRFGLYTADGQPDIVAAHNAVNELKQEFSGEVDARVQQRVQPVVQVLQNAHAATRIADIVKIGTEFGADPVILQTYAANAAQADPAILDNNEAVVGLIALARGMSAMATPAVPAKLAAAAAPATPVVVPAPNLTERPGQRTTVAPSLSGIERVIATKRGMTNDQWAARSKEFEKMDPTRGLVAEKD